MTMTPMMTVMTTKNDDDDDVHRLSVGRTLLLLVAGLLLHCLANLGKNLNIFPLLLSPHPDDFRIFFMTMKISTSVLILKILVFWICHNHENIDLLRQVLDHSGALWHAVSGTSLLRHHVVSQLGIIDITGLTISAKMSFLLQKFQVSIYSPIFHYDIPTLQWGTGWWYALA